MSWSRALWALPCLRDDNANNCTWFCLWRCEESRGCCSDWVESIVPAPDGCSPGNASNCFLCCFSHFLLLFFFLKFFSALIDVVIFLLRQFSGTAVGEISDALHWQYLRNTGKGPESQSSRTEFNFLFQLTWMIGVIVSRTRSHARGVQRLSRWAT
jgi:hypothetical protein